MRAMRLGLGIGLAALVLAGGRGASGAARRQQEPPALTQALAAGHPLAMSRLSIAAPVPAAPAAPRHSRRAAERRPWRVGVQIGHWRLDDLPAELANLRAATGAYAAGVEELEVNLGVGRRVRAYLEQAGVLVDLLPARVPPGYRADAVVSLHADGAPGLSPADAERRRGWKIAAPWRASPAALLLRDSLAAAYRAGPIPADPAAPTLAMSGYYAFNPLRFRHAVAPGTPAVLLELGFLTNSADRLALTGRQDALARLISGGLLAYLRAGAGAARRPAAYPALLVAEGGASLRAGPWPDSPPAAELRAGEPLLALDRRPGWWLAIPGRDWGRLGWIADAATAAGPRPGPPPGAALPR